MNSRHHERFMEVCLHLAEKGRGLVSPNPLVGAVLVRANRIVAQGYHRRFGGPHAEVECLRRYSGDPGSTTLYVNLEPCTYFGKTPPCTDLIIRSGIKTVVVGMKDPNPRVNGSGIRRLRTSGITVVPDVLEGNARALNRAFITYVTKARPLVHVKIAQSLDGKIAQRLNSSTRVTGREAERLVHRMRSEHDAILVGAGTVHVDNPLLNVRLVKGIDPAVVVIDGRLSVEVERRLWRTARHRRVILLTSPRSIRNHANKVKELCSYGVEVVPVESSAYRLPLRNIIATLYDRNISSVLVEGGRDILSQFISEGPIDTLSVFLAPRLFGSGVPSLGSQSGEEMTPSWLNGVEPKVTKFGHDVLIQYAMNEER